VSPQAAVFARDVIARTGPQGLERARTWVGGKFADYAIPLGLEAVPEVLGDRRHCSSHPWDQQPIGMVT
jgi:hypothetical protein